MASNDKADKKVANKSAKKTESKLSKFRPIRYFKEVYGELKKVTWPTRKDMVSHTGAVFAFVIAMAIIIGVLDLIFSQGTGLLASIGKSSLL